MEEERFVVTDDGILGRGRALRREQKLVFGMKVVPAGSCSSDKQWGTIVELSLIQQRP